MRKPFATLTLTLVALGIALSGCTALGLGDYTLAKRSDIEARIDKARAEAAAKLDALRTQETGLLKQTIAEHNAREQAAADYLFKGSAVFGTLKPDQISRPTLVMGQSIQQTAAQLPPATAAAQAKAFRDLQTELDEVKTSTEALKAQYEKELGQARAEGAAKAKALEDLSVKVSAVEAEKVKVLTKAGETERALQAEKDKVQDKETAKAREDAAAAKRNEALKRWLMAGLGVIALACGAAAVFVPIPAVKQWGTIVAVAAGLLAFAVPFIEPFHVLITVLCICVPVGLRIVWAYKQEHDVATNTYRAIQSVKDNSKDDYERVIKPALQSWHTRYTKDGTPIKDDTATRLIDKRLMDIGDK